MRRIFGTSKLHLKAPSDLGCCPFQGGDSVVLVSLLIVAPIVGFYVCSLVCCALLCVLSSFAIIFIGKRGLVTLLCMSS